MEEQEARCEKKEYEGRQENMAEYGEESEDEGMKRKDSRVRRRE